MTREELLSLPTVESRRTHGGDAPIVGLETLKTRHHEIARLLAAGITDTEVSKIMSVSLSTLSTLRRAPAFEALLLQYMAMRDERAIDLGVKIAQVAEKALEKVGELLDQPAAALDGDLLRKVATDLLDRAGHSPVAKSATVTAALTPQDIRALRLARSEAAQMQVIDHDDLKNVSPNASGGPRREPPPVEPGSPISPGLGLRSAGGPRAVPGGPAAEGAEGGGAAVREETGEEAVA
jgi:hypothetical protein